MTIHPPESIVGCNRRNQYPAADPFGGLGIDRHRLCAAARSYKLPRYRNGFSQRPISTFRHEGPIRSKNNIFLLEEISCHLGDARHPRFLKRLMNNFWLSYYAVFVGYPGFHKNRSSFKIPRYNCSDDCVPFFANSFWLWHYWQLCDLPALFASLTARHTALHIRDAKA